jgi:hypothetical protein
LYEELNNNNNHDRLFFIGGGSEEIKRKLKMREKFDD